MTSLRQTMMYLVSYGIGYVVLTSFDFPILFTASRVMWDCMVLWRSPMPYPGIQQIRLILLQQCITCSSSQKTIRVGSTNLGGSHDLHLQPGKKDDTDRNEAPPLQGTRMKWSRMKHHHLVMDIGDDLKVVHQGMNNVLSI